MIRKFLLSFALAAMAISPAVAQVANGKVTTAPPVYVNNTANGLSLDTSGGLRVNCISGCVAGAGTVNATSTAAAPTYVEGTPNSLSLNLSGSLRTTLTTPIPAGTNNIGDVDVLTLPSIPAGTNNIGDVDVLTLPALPAGTNTIGRVLLPNSSNSTVVNVTAATSNTVCLAANVNRNGAVIANDSTDVLYIKLGATASLTSYTYAIAGKTTVPGLLEVPYDWKGIISCIWSGTNGAARVTERTP